MRRAIVLLAVTTLASCDSSPVDIAGNYTLAVTNHDNGCGFPNWTVDDSSTNIPLTVLQEGGDVTATLEGAVGVWVDAVLGGKSFIGAVSGHEMDVTLHGTRAYNDGGCTYTVTARAVATLTGDTLEGTIDYTTATNGGCGALEECVSTQAFNGTRPPP